MQNFEFARLYPAITLRETAPAKHGQGRRFIMKSLSLPAFVSFVPSAHTFPLQEGHSSGSVCVCVSVCTVLIHELTGVTPRYFSFSSCRGTEGSSVQ